MEANPLAEAVILIGGRAVAPKWHYKARVNLGTP